MDICNGLLLFCHHNVEFAKIMCGVKRYYVMNPLTKQYVAVLKPTRQISCGYSYVALEYVLVKFWFFKIVHFEGYWHVNVFLFFGLFWPVIDEKILTWRWPWKRIILKNQDFTESYAEATYEYPPEVCPVEFKIAAHCFVTWFIHDIIVIDTLYNICNFIVVAK
jgi:hypothetical protein